MFLFDNFWFGCYECYSIYFKTDFSMLINYNLFLRTFLIDIFGSTVNQLTKICVASLRENIFKMHDFYSNFSSETGHVVTSSSFWKKELQCS